MCDPNDPVWINRCIHCQDEITPENYPIDELSGLCRNCETEEKDEED